MKKDIKKFEKKLIFLAASLIFVLAIIFWPIYFFVFSGLNILAKDIFALLFFIVIEFILIGLLFFLWKIYERIFVLK